VEYFYTAKSRQGLEESGITDAVSKEDLAYKLREQDLVLISAKAKQKKEVSAIDKFLSRLRPVSQLQKVLLFKHLGVMLKAGVSLAEGFEILSMGGKRDRLKKICTEIRKDLEKGNSLASALAKHPDTFPETTISVVRVGEISGQLQESFYNLSVQMKKDYDLMRKVKGALMYPAVILVAMIGIGILMMVMVIPQLAEIFSEMEVELPLATRIVLGTSMFIVQNGTLTVGVVLVTVVVLLRFLKTESGTRISHKILIKIPLVSPIVKKINLARFTRTLSSLSKSGVPIIQSLEITRDTLGNIYYKEAIQKMQEKVKKGVAINEAIPKEATYLFPHLVTQMMAIGEKTGSLEDVLVDIATFYEEEVAQTMENLSSIIEPILMLVLGGAVGLVALSVISPIYSLMDQV